MLYVKRGLIALIILIAGGFLHYTLPSHEIVRIVESEVRRVEVGSGSIFWGSSEPADATSGNRDVKFISAVNDKGRTRVYRNEDTGWGWPPYFKLNSSDLQARAADLTSTAADPQWVDVKYYGWRSNFLSIYPNAVRIRPVDGPDVTIINWFNIVFLTALAALILYVWRLWSRFHERRIEPILDDVGEALGFADDEPEPEVEKKQGFGQRLKALFTGRSGS